MKPNETKELVLKYFQSWQQPSDFDEMRSYLADDLKFDGGIFAAKSADQLIAIVKQTESPWKDVHMLGSLFSEDKATIFYEGTDIKSSKKIRVAELLTIQNGKISQVIAAINPLD